MGYAIKVFILLCLIFTSEKLLAQSKSVSTTAYTNPDLVLFKRADSYGDFSGEFLKNISKDKTYTVTVRRREFRTKYKTNLNPPDTIVVSKDTLIQYANVVVPAGKWRYLSVTWSGEGETQPNPNIMANNVERRFRFKIISAETGGDVRQYLTKPEPFDKFQPSPLYMGRQDKEAFKRFYDTYQGDNKK